MNEQSSTDVRIEVASVTDRGLSEKRPLNEDSMLADAERHIFAVADGVGGAEAGEVASQTAIEVLEEAFRHHREGDDIEDLMEIAIQRANSSIHQMSREHPKLSMMATTLVALHLDGRRATIGHVGDSRLYRFSPEGKLHRETDDHSIVEEEVRAGRMTLEQAAHHPSRNVISRALGAEPSVEVDMKTIEVEEGTIFLLCSDGITRHITDDELRSIIHSKYDLEEACAEMRRCCFERGAEDNLTAVVVRLGEREEYIPLGGDGDWDEETTIISERPVAPPPQHVTQSSEHSPKFAPPSPPFLNETLVSSSALSTAAERSPRLTIPAEPPASVFREPAPPPSRPPARGAIKAVGFLLLLLAASGAAFYGGTLYQTREEERKQRAAAASVVPDTEPLPSPESSDERFAKLCREVDRVPDEVATRMSGELAGEALSTKDAEFLYLYGRALLLSGKDEKAIDALRAAAKKIEEDVTPDGGRLRVDTKMAEASALLRVRNFGEALTTARTINTPPVTYPSVEPSPVPSPTMIPIQ
ncbi:MAG TPA: Stp1/IreP family PP2C-type Ser/Thr phosphatase [Pyrinomonadaceae bacterium]|nr:Stp1/IreP family PP2C-type Ser/Thr phosphatase [Pyrinomonadaceae bacterium]